MKHINIHNSSHPLYEAFETLYASSFPVFEQRTREQQEAAFSNVNYHLSGYEANDTFVGFISYWEFDDYLYIEHFAINTHIRGKGYGSDLLRRFIQSTDKIVLLEIDPINDSVSEARLRFYKKCGFYENPYPHKHPSYRSEYRPHPLIVLTTQQSISEKEYQTFNHDLGNTVMNFPPSCGKGRINTEL